MVRTNGLVNIKNKAYKANDRFFNFIGKLKSNNRKNPIYINTNKLIKNEKNTSACTIFL
jgi:hypothetical protein